MHPTGRRGLALALVAGTALLAPACGGDDPAAVPPPTQGTDTTAARASAPAGGTSETARLVAYREDVLVASGALRDFGNALGRVRGAAGLADRLDALEADLDVFDAAIANLSGYELGDLRLERQRAGLVRTGPAVSDVLRRFLAAAAAEDPAAVQDLLPDVRAAVAEFERAVTGRSQAAT